MATKSFLKTVNINNIKLGNALADALDRASSTPASSVELKSTTKELKGDEVKSFFDGYKKYE